MGLEGAAHEPRPAVRPRVLPRDEGDPPGSGRTRHGVFAEPEPGAALRPRPRRLGERVAPAEPVDQLLGARQSRGGTLWGARAGRPLLAPALRGDLRRPGRI